ncbi:MAG: PQQ-binding-like beta-propeller repeat protein [Pirellulaceae bacterium]|nr:PQQ-binding-like beta-propeller repeat protein [Pirellulaceae bacterium]
MASLKALARRTLLIAAILAPGDLGAQVSDLAVVKVGLETAWVAQTQSDLSRGVAWMGLWRDPHRARNFAVVETADQMVCVPVDQLDDLQQPLGIEKAKITARARAARLVGSEYELAAVERSIPELQLVVASSDGVVTCFDAETGKLHWKAVCGAATAPVYSCGLATAGVVVLQGDSLYLLDWRTGKQIAAKQLASGTSNSVGVIEQPLTSDSAAQEKTLRTESVALVSDFAGQINAYGVSGQRNAWAYRLSGRVANTPISLPDGSHTAFVTDKGWMYVFSAADGPAIQFRYECGARFVGSLAAGRDAFYIGDAAGTFCKILTSENGVSQWKIRFSQSISAMSLVDQQQGIAYVCSESGELNAVDDSTGSLVWARSAYCATGIRGPIAIANSTVVTRTLANTLVAHDSKSGRQISETPSLPLMDMMFVNDLTDRVYLLGNHGQLQCLRPRGKVLPKINRVADQPSDSPATTASAAAPSTRSVPSETLMEDTPSSGDTFDDDPFGDSSQPNSDTDDGQNSLPANEFDADSSLF